MNNVNNNSNNVHIYPTILLSNIRSLPNKFEDLCLNINKLSPHITTITETWLNNEMSDELFSIPNYVLIRNDRSNRLGGGVANWIHKSMNSKLLPHHDKPEMIECLWILVNNHILICSCYIPPNLPVNDYTTISNYFINYVDKFKSDNNNSKVIFNGDFNNMNLSSLTIELNLINTVTSPTRGNSILDYILIEADIKDVYPNPCTIYSPIASSDHNVVLLKGSPSPHSIYKPIIIFDYRSHILESTNYLLNNVNWNQLYNTEASLNEKCKFFYDTTIPIFNTIPKSIVWFSPKDKPWITPVTKHLIDKRWQAYRIKNFPLYNHYKIKCKEEIQKAKKNWYSKAIRDKKKGLWNIINTYRKRPNNFLDISATPEEINNHFCNFYSHSDTTFQLADLNNGSSWDLRIEPSMVEKFLSKIKSKSSGNDGLTPTFLKYNAKPLSYPLSHLFNISIISRTFPDCWKISKVIPIPKKTKPNINDLRPISILPIVSRIFEKCIATSLSRIFIENYGPEQFGFRAGSNSTCAVISLVDSVHNALSLKDTKCVSIISYDASKAFDMIKHDILLQKLIRTNIPFDFIKWYADYLTNRTQYVFHNNDQSSSRRVTSGVPQGSILSPYMFCIFISELKSILTTNKIFKYADDMALLICHSNKPNDEMDCIVELNNVRQWTERNGIKLNHSKSARLTICKRNTSIDYPCISTIKCYDSIKLLGIFLDKNMQWHEHIKYSVSKACRNIHLLRTLKRVLSRKELIITYKSLIQSHLDYGSELYAGSIQQRDSILIQKTVDRCHKIICGSNCDLNCLGDMNSRRSQKSLSLFKNALQNSSHCLHNIMPIFLPSNRRVTIHHTYSTIHNKSFVIYNSMLYNNTN